MRRLFSFAPSIVFSLTIHAIVLLLLSLWFLPSLVSLVPELSLTAALDEEIRDLTTSEEDVLDINLEPGAEAMLAVPLIDLAAESASPEVAVFAPQPISTTPTLNFSDIFTPAIPVSRQAPLSTNALANRSDRGAAVAMGGGNEASERAVARALRWIADHQFPDGSWAYTQVHNPNCQGQCPDCEFSKANKGRMSATAMALLPMLGAGITHREGRYRAQVKAGLDFIVNNRTEVQEGLILTEQISFPFMYHQALSTIVVCEAAAMTRDKDLGRIAEEAVRYICWAQDPIGGGWRYTPKQQGDTSGLGWNFMALKSASMGNIDVPMMTVIKTKNFLDNVVGVEDGAKYGYLNNDLTSEDGLNREIEAVTAIGLLSQMYMGWQADDSALKRGTDYLDEWGPDPDNLYYSYYATQVMHHAGGEKWERWNQSMRDSLIQLQVSDRNSHAFGSWDNTGGGSIASGGRLTSTSLATMILEVYYRHMPLYRATTAEDFFPLE